MVELLGRLGPRPCLPVGRSASALPASQRSQPRPSTSSAPSTRRVSHGPMSSPRAFSCHAVSKAEPQNGQTTASPSVQPASNSLAQTLQKNSQLKRLRTCFARLVISASNRCWAVEKQQPLGSYAPPGVSYLSRRGIVRSQAQPNSPRTASVSLTSARRPFSV